MDRPQPTQLQKKRESLIVSQPILQETLRVLNNSKKVSNLKLVAYMDKRLDSIHHSPSITQKQPHLIRGTVKKEFVAGVAGDSGKRDCKLRKRLQKINFECQRFMSYFETQSKEISRLIQKIQMDQAYSVEAEQAPERIKAEGEYFEPKICKPRKREAKLRDKTDPKRPVIRSKSGGNAKLHQVKNSPSNVFEQTSIKSGFSGGSNFSKAECALVSLHYQNLQNLPTETSKGLLEYDRQAVGQQEESSYPDIVGVKLSPSPLQDHHFQPSYEHQSFPQHVGLRAEVYRDRSFPGIASQSRDMVVSFNNQIDQSLPMNPPLAGDISYFQTPFKIMGSSEANFEKTYFIMQESSAEKVRMQLF